MWGVKNRGVEDVKSFCGYEKQKLTPRTTEQSHKKRLVVNYEIINRGVALGDGNRGGGLQKRGDESRRKFHPCVLGPLTVAGDLGGFCNFVYILHAAGECKFEAIS